MDTAFGVEDISVVANLDTDYQIPFVDLTWGKSLSEPQVNNTMKTFIAKKLDVSSSKQHTLLGRNLEITHPSHEFTFKQGFRNNQFNGAKCRPCCGFNT